MYILNFSPEVSNISGYSVGLFASYMLNRKYTFKSIQNQKSEIIKFLSVFFIAYATNFILLIILIHKFGVNEGVSQVLTGIVYIATSYMLNKNYVFNLTTNSDK